MKIRTWVGSVLVVSLIGVLCQPVDLFARPGGGRPSGGGARPSGGSRAPSRPSPSARPAPSRPSPSAKPAAGSRPSPSGDIRKNLPSKPSGNLSGAASKAAAGGLSGKASGAMKDRAGSRPTQGQVQDFLKASGGNGAAASAAKSRVDAAKTASGSAVSEFLNNKGAGAAAAAATSPKNVAGSRADAISNRTDARSDVRGSRGENRDFASDKRQDRVSGRGDRQTVRVENRGDVRTDLASGRSDRRTTRQQNLGTQADSIRSQLNSAYDSGLHQEFWSGLQTGHYYFDKNPIFWSWAGFRTVSAIMPWNWGEGRYYDYGSGGGSYYDGSSVMYNGEAVPAEEYAQQAEELALSVPEEDDAESSDASGDEWLPLGVFAVAQEGESSATPTMFMQLAVRKDGVIAGTYQNKETGETASLEGMIDGGSQRAAWTFSGKTSPIVETGIQNLTMNETQVLVHFQDGDSKTYLLVRVENPDAKSSS